MVTNAPPFDSIADVGDADAVRDVVLRQFEQTFRHALTGPAVTKTDDSVLLVTGEPHPFGNLAILSDAADLATVEAAVEPLVAQGAPAAVAFAVEAIPAETAAYLRARGFTHEEPMPAMAVDIERLADTRLPDGFEFVRVQAEDATAWCRALADGYEIPVAVARLFSPVTIDAGTAPDAPIQFFAILENGEPVCTSILHLAGGVAGVYCVATVAERRGRGLGAHATAAPLRLARDLGYRVGVLQSSSAGHPVYRRLGFTDFGVVPMHLRLPSASAPT